MDLYRPSEDQIQKVMQQTGMDCIQARNHLLQRHQIQQDLQRNPPRYSMGKSAYDSDQQRVK